MLKSVKADFVISEPTPVSAIAPKGMKMKALMKASPSFKLESSLFKPVAGEAGIDYEIVRTKQEAVEKVLAERMDKKDIDEMLQSRDFLTVLLVMSIKMKDPNTWRLSWGRFIFDIDGSSIAVPSFSPDSNGIKAQIEKNQSREASISLSAEIGPSFSSKTTTKAGDTTNETTLSTGLKVSPGIKLDSKSGWAIKYEETVDEVRGFKTRDPDGGIDLQWDIYANTAVEVPKSNIGATAVVYGSAMISAPKNVTRPVVTVEVSGEARRRTIPITGSIVLTSVGKFSVEQTVGSENKAH